MFFVTFHALDGNIRAYDDNGKLLEKAVLDKGGVELRGIYLQSFPKKEYLYVVDGSKSASKIYRYEGTGTSYKYVADFITTTSADSIDHPFALAFDGMGNCYVSNQNTNVVAALEVSSKGHKVKPNPVASYLQGLYPSGKFLQGTLAASSQADLPGAPQTNGIQAVPEELGGLGVEINTSDSKKPKVQNSVRDVVFYNLEYSGETIRLLFVVDEVAGLIRVYDPDTGTPLMESNRLESPVHLLINNGTIYVGAKKQILSSPVPNPKNQTATPWAFTPIEFSPQLPKGSVSGMAFDGHGNFHVAIRTIKQVMKYDSDFKNGVGWHADPLPDYPEFLLYVPDK
jgi:hypothetical protein